ncbi:MAG: endonuclease [Thermoplasmatota archaeon]
MGLKPHQLYSLLHDHFGQLNWWPVDQRYHRNWQSDPRFEIMVGAILTQNTAWSNVEKALLNLKNKKALSVEKIVHLPLDQVKKLIQPSGFFNQKATRLKNLSHMIYESYDNNIDKMFDTDISLIRAQLLSLNGIGPETADSIILYAGNLPIFVVDAYTTRLYQRIPLSTDHPSYNTIQKFFETDLNRQYPKEELVFIYQQLHALLVEVAKQFCKKKPLCDSCPVKKSCKTKLF